MDLRIPGFVRGVARWAWRRTRRLERLDRRPTRMPRDAVVVLSTMRNEAPRLPAFLAHYRGLGAARFILVDNGSDDDTAERALAEPDCHVFRATGDFRAARFGLDWLVRLGRELAYDHWGVHVDADELLDYPHAPELPLPALARYLTAEGATALGATLVDLYAPGPLAAAPPIDGPGSPLERFPCFDTDSTFLRPELAPMRGPWGGPRHRLFGVPVCLSKFPLVRIARGTELSAGMHAVAAPRVSRVAAAVLHLKLVGGFAARVREEVARDVHWQGSIEYRAYARWLAARPDLDPTYAGTARYTGWRSLAAHGLVTSTPGLEHFAAGCAQGAHRSR